MTAINYTEILHSSNKLRRIINSIAIYVQGCKERENIMCVAVKENVN